MYAGAPVASDVRFGYTLGDEARRKLLSFWNIYTFFETYAKIDKPNFEGYVPDKSKMTPTDLWLTVRTNEFLKRATACYNDYKVYLLVKDFEVFVDDISNWYVRTNRRRFWKADDEQDKMLAYWVLFHALNTAVQVMAPVIPFMTEYIWQTLTRKVLPNAPLSVHLSDWPQPLADFEDNGIVEQTAFAREAIAVAMRLRNEQQLKVRQPLAAMYVCCDKASADKLKTFEKNILDELNIKALHYLESADALEDKYLTVNFKVAGAVLKQNVNKMKQTLEALSDTDMAAVVSAVEAGGQVTIPGFDGSFDAELFNVSTKTKTGIVSAEFANGTAVVALDTKLTEMLIREGLVRDVVRQCQIARKEAGYEVEQRVRVSICADNAQISDALSEKIEYLRNELLAEEVRIGSPLETADYEKEAEISGSKVTLSVCKA